MKQSKKQYFKNFSKNNIKNMKNTWKGIKTIISLKTSESESPKTIVNSNGEFLTNPVDIANSFNNFFVLLHQISNPLLKKPSITFSLLSN